MTDSKRNNTTRKNRNTVFSFLAISTPGTVIPGVTAGLISGVITVIIEISFAVLIFSGDLTSFVSHGIGFTLFGACVMSLITTATSSFSGIVTFPQDTSAALLALVAASIASSMPAGTPAEETYATVVTAIVLTSLLTGIFFLLLGTFKLGRFIRYIPYPVIGGFLAGTGWLLLKGGLEVMTDSMIGLSQFAFFFQSDVIFKWLPGFLFAVLLLFTLRRLKHFTVLPAAVAFATGIFYLVIWLIDMPISTASSRGWLLGLFPEGTLWHPLHPSILQHVRWVSIWRQMGTIGTILIISAISLLLNISGLELISHRDMDLDREMKTAGAANLAAGLGGSPVGYHTLSLSALGYKVGSNTRLIGIITAAVCAAALVLGAGIVRIFPKFLLGGLISFLGASFLVEWLYDGWFRLSKVDYFLVVLILIVIGTLGYLQGVGIGILAAMCIFTANYSRIRVIQRRLSGAQQQSNVDRPSYQRRILRERGEQLSILKLQGFIFFGTANTLYQEVKNQLHEVRQPPPQYILFDFRRVTGFDGSAEVVFIKILQLARESHAQLVFTNLASQFQGGLKRVFSGDPASYQVQFFPDLDHGVEWCEDRILASQQLQMVEETQSLHAFLQSTFHRPDHVKKLMGYLEKKEVAPNRYLIRQGEAARHLYFIESGEFAAQLELRGEKPIRLRTMREGAIFGEIALYLDIPRSLSVVATKPSTVYQLSSEALEKMAGRDPDLAVTFQNYVIRLLAERLVDLNRTLEALSD